MGEVSRDERCRMQALGEAIESHGKTQEGRVTAGFGALTGQTYIIEVPNDPNDVVDAARAYLPFLLGQDTVDAEIVEAEPVDDLPKQDGVLVMLQQRRGEKLNPATLGELHEALVDELSLHLPDFPAAVRRTLGANLALRFQRDTEQF